MEDKSRLNERGRIIMSNFMQQQQDNTSVNSPLGGSEKKHVKTLFDHGHNKRNKMVIYDDDPRIEAVMKAALDRHQQKVKGEETFLKRQ
jgi:hypothetical protein